MKPGLTAQQDKLLGFIETSLAEARVGPSFEAMRAHMGISSKSGIHRILSALEDRGYIRKLPNKARAISLVTPLASIPTFTLIQELRLRGVAL